MGHSLIDQVASCNVLAEYYDRSNYDGRKEGATVGSRGPQLPSGSFTLHPDI